MSTMRDHLRQHHEICSENHQGLADAFQGMAEHHRVLSSRHTGEISEGHKALGEKCAKVASHFQNLADHNVSCAQALAATNPSDADAAKSVGWPAGVSGVAPDNPHYRAVPRTSQRELPVKPNVPLEFEKLIEIEDVL